MRPAGRRSLPVWQLALLSRRRPLLLWQFGTGPPLRRRRSLLFVLLKGIQIFMPMHHQRACMCLSPPAGSCLWRETQSVPCLADSYPLYRNVVAGGKATARVTIMITPLPLITLPHSPSKQICHMQWVSFLQLKSAADCSNIAVPIPMFPSPHLSPTSQVRALQSSRYGTGPAPEKAKLWVYRRYKSTLTS